jgi:hypothetical protein
MLEKQPRMGLPISTRSPFAAARNDSYNRLAVAGLAAFLTATLTTAATAATALAALAAAATALFSALAATGALLAALTALAAFSISLSVS